MDGLLRRHYDPTVRGRSREIAAVVVALWAVRSLLYTLAGFLGDVSTAREGRTGRRVARHGEPQDYDPDRKIRQQEWKRTGNDTEPYAAHGQSITAFYVHDLNSNVGLS